MIAKAHCFTKNVKIDKLPISFKFGDVAVLIHESTNKKEEGGLILEISQKVDPATLLVKPEEQDPQGKFIEKRLKPYKIKLNEVASLLEGLLSIFYLGTPPSFDTHKVMVNIEPESPEEEKMIQEERVSRGFGDVLHQEQYPLYTWSEQILPNIEVGKKHIPALSFLAQAIRSQARKDEEVAFFLYFRVIEGYLGDGSERLQDALLYRANELKKYLSDSTSLKDAFKTILVNGLSLSSHSHENYDGMIKDLVLIRHKLIHFNEEYSDRHYNPNLKFELAPINFYLRKACVLILRDKIGVDKEDT